MSDLNVNEIYGYYLLVSEGLQVYNPKYVERYGSFMRCLMRLNSKPKRPTTEYLKESYAASAASAKFFATYPRDLSNLSVKDLRKLRREHENNM